MLLTILSAFQVNVDSKNAFCFDIQLKKGRYRRSDKRTPYRQTDRQSHYCYYNIDVQFFSQWFCYLPLDVRIPKQCLELKLNDGKWVSIAELQTDRQIDGQTYSCYYNIDCLVMLGLLPGNTGSIA